MYAFKFVYVSAIFLLALVQGVVSQDIEPVPLGGSYLYATDNSLLYLQQKPCVVGLKCCILGPDHGICMLNCP
ncbi:hypothetical protein DFH09DRAFT_1158025 [Mycena vulgaris]|nr:hypothetical protein DFH09DRAFT_1158025 [Mycena vulgaris]